MNSIKRLVLVAVAVIALTASLGAAGASASTSGFLAGTYPATLRGTDTGILGTDVLEAYGGKWECSPPGIHASQAGPSAVMAASGYDYSGACGGPSPGAVVMNGCNFTWDPGPGPEFDGTVAIGPTGCGPIEMENIFFGCDLIIEPGAGYTAPASFENKAGVVNVFAEATNLPVKQGGGVFCNESGKAKWYPAFRVAAENGEGAPTELQLVSELPLGFYMAGKESGNGAEQPRFEAERYALAVSGGGLNFVAAGVTVACTSSSLKDSVTKVTKELTLDATSSGCTATENAGAGLKYPTTIEMKSCYYTLSAQNVGPPYSGLWGIACGKAGDKIEYKAYNEKGVLSCTIKAGPQSGLSSVSLANVGSGVNRGVSLTADVKGIQWEQSGICGSGTGTNGKMKGSSTLLGTG